MAENPNYYHCHLPADMSMYDHLPYHINPKLCDGSSITLHTGNVIRGCPINVLEKRLIVPNEDTSSDTNSSNLILNDSSDYDDSKETKENSSEYEDSEETKENSSEYEDSEVSLNNLSDYDESEISTDDLYD